MKKIISMVVVANEKGKIKPKMGQSGQVIHGFNISGWTKAGWKRLWSSEEQELETHPECRAYDPELAEDLEIFEWLNTFDGKLKQSFDDPDLKEQRRKQDEVPF